MSTKTHDELIKKAVRWAEALGYEVVEHHLGTETGADAIFQNQFQETVILEVVTGGRFKGLFEKDRIGGRLKADMDYATPSLLGIIVVADRINNIEKHAQVAGLSDDLFYPPDQRIFPVTVLDFKEVIPVLMVKLLGSKASAYGRWGPE